MLIDVLIHRNPNVMSTGELDLHGLQSKAAVALVQIYLHKFKKKGRNEVTIIYGKGLHSDGAAVVKPAVIEVMSQSSSW